jgi:hypothetical protein
MAAMPFRGARVWRQCRSIARSGTAACLAALPLVSTRLAAINGCITLQLGQDQGLFYRFLRGKGSVPLECSGAGFRNPYVMTLHRMYLLG